MHWEILDTGTRSAAENMLIDSELLTSIGSRSRPLLHFYDWEADSATYGYFTDPFAHLSQEGVEAKGLQLARRPTGGGIIFHIWDMAFSVLVPATCPEFSLNTLENYAFVNGAVLAAVGAFFQGTFASEMVLIPDDLAERDRHCGHFCMAKPTRYDVVWNGKKVAGAAQRRTKEGYLHQGTIALVMPPEEYLDTVLLPGTQVAEAMQASTWPLLRGDADQSAFAKVKRDLKALLTTQLNASSLKCTASLT